MGSEEVLNRRKKRRERRSVTQNLMIIANVLFSWAGGKIKEAAKRCFDTCAPTARTVLGKLAALSVRKRQKRVGPGGRPRGKGVKISDLEAILRELEAMESGNPEVSEVSPVELVVPRDRPQETGEDVVRQQPETPPTVLKVHQESRFREVVDVLQKIQYAKKNRGHTHESGTNNELVRLLYRLTNLAFPNVQFWRKCGSFFEDIYEATQNGNGQTLVTTKMLDKWRGARTTGTKRGWRVSECTDPIGGKNPTSITWDPSFEIDSKGIFTVNLLMTDLCDDLDFGAFMSNTTLDFCLSMIFTHYSTSEFWKDRNILLATTHMWNGWIVKDSNGDNLLTTLVSGGVQWHNALIPIHIRNNHWGFAWLDFEQKTYFCYDPYGVEMEKEKFCQLEQLLNVLGHGKWESSKWKFVKHQRDGHSCGWHVLIQACRILKTKPGAEEIDFPKAHECLRNVKGVWFRTLMDMFEMQEKHAFVTVPTK